MGQADRAERWQSPGTAGERQKFDQSDSMRAKSSAHAAVRSRRSERLPIGGRTDSDAGKKAPKTHRTNPDTKVLFTDDGGHERPDRSGRVCKNTTTEASAVGQERETRNGNEAATTTQKTTGKQHSYCGYSITDTK